MTLGEFVLSEDLVLLLLCCCGLVASLIVVCFEHSYGNAFCKAFFFCQVQLLLLQRIDLVERGNEFALSLQLLHLVVYDLIE